MQLRISKYDPSDRKQQEFCNDNYWCAINDVNNDYYSKGITLKHYFQIENSYCESIRLLLEFQKIDHLIISSCDTKRDVPKFFISKQYCQTREDLKGKLYLGRQCTWHETELIMRATLRNEFWCNFKGISGTYLHFAYDFYMFYGSNHSLDLHKLQFPEGIFIEENYPSPYLL